MPEIITLSQIPPPATKPIALRVNAPAERALREGHPWLFADSIERQSFEGQAGDLAVIFDRKDRFLAVGLYDPCSPIRVKVLQHNEPATINRSWLQNKMQTAVIQRRALESNHTDGYRLVHGENDGLPGLVVDRYEHVYVLKLYTVAWIPHLSDLLYAFRAVGPKSKVVPQRIVLRLSRAVQALPDLLYGLEDGALLAGPTIDAPILFKENSLIFEVDVVQGQKTGFFLDQRDNRARVESLTYGKTVLNLFAYTGGFSLYAARGGAQEVLSADLSEPALATAVRNFAHNQHHANIARAQHTTRAGDAFAILRQLADEQRRFDVVIIDPPAFAKSQSEVDNALHAYRRLVQMGLAVLHRGGTLVMASCSSRVEADTFFALIHETANNVGRPLQELERTYQPLDHPIGFKEGAYLKCLFAIAS